MRCLVCLVLSSVCLSAAGTNLVRNARFERMACEIKSYEAYFLSTDAPPPVAGAPDALACRAWRLGGKTLFVAVNTTREPLSADVTVDGRPVSLALGPTEVKIIENSRKDKQ